MKITIRTPDINKEKQIILRQITQENIMVKEKAVISIDGSTSNTGLSIIRESDGALYYSCALTREDKETPVQFKVRLKRFVQDILVRNRLIETVYYEEPFVGHITAVANLMMLRTFIEELIFEQEPTFDYIKHSEINNLKWKKDFLAPDKVPQGTELQKKAVRDKLLGYLPFLKDLTEDEIDSYAMGWCAVAKKREGIEDALESKKKARAFKYNISFSGADSDDDVLQELMEIYKGPQVVLENGIEFKEIPGRVNFNKQVYEFMGGEDKLLIIKFSSNHHGNLILEHKIGHLASQYDYLYALVWRKTRKH